ncbi:hypothetical protein MRX96_008038 [Rhipicephalus microplus]
MAMPTVPTAQPETLLNPFIVKLPEKLDFWRPEEWKWWFTRLVVGLADAQLSEKLQLNAELTLEATVTTARNSEAIKMQQKDLRPQQQVPAAVDTMRGCSKSKGKANQRS